MTLMLKDLPESEKPRERLISVGASNLSNSELLSLILRTGTQGENVGEISKRILSEFKSLEELKDINREKLLKIKGIGLVKTSQILAVIELGKRIFLKKESNKKYTLTNPKIIYERNKYLFDNKKQEYFYCIYLNTKKEMIDKKLLFIGTLNKSYVHPREVFKEAHLLSASSIICMHNHPSGDCTPSNDDIELTKILIEIGRLQQIPVVDHIIFGNNKYFSFYENDIFLR